jgi:hypothetical protein
LKNNSIGTLRESSLHRSLKSQYSLGGFTEKAVGGYVCDGQAETGEFIEVQTGSFAPLKEKLRVLTKSDKVKVIYPIITQKTIELYDISGSLVRRRKSPRKGSVWDLFKALVNAPQLPLLKNFSLELALVDVIEKRIDDGSGSWRRKGVRISDRVLSACHESLILNKPRDYSQFIPFKKTECFTVMDLAEKARIDVSLARKTLYVLSKIGLTERAGKRKKAFVYKRK